MSDSTTTLGSTSTPSADVIELPVKPRRSGRNERSFGEPFTEDTANANRRHDKDYGWRSAWPREYTNMARLPGYVKVPPGLTNSDDIWAALGRAEEARRAALKSALEGLL